LRSRTIFILLEEWQYFPYKTVVFFIKFPIFFLRIDEKSKDARLIHQFNPKWRRIFIFATLDISDLLVRGFDLVPAYINEFIY
jgi:hypothetical protein